MTETLNQPVVIGQLIVALATFLAAIATMRAASATRRQAKITETIFRRSLRPMIRVDWRLLNRVGDKVFLNAAIRETAGNPCALLSGKARFPTWSGQPSPEIELPLTNVLLQGAHHTDQVSIPIEIGDLPDQYPAMVTHVSLDLIVSARGEAEQIPWVFECVLVATGKDKFDLSEFPVDSSVLHERVPPA